MAYEEKCMYCFEDRGLDVICPHCGRDSRAAVPQAQMPPGTLIYHDRFLVGRALGQDSSGIVYAALDTRRNNRIRMREYYPRDCAERLSDGTVVPVSGLEDRFDRGMHKLRASIENVDDPRKRHFYFEENGTAYVAQRLSASAARERREPVEDEEGSDLKQVGLIIGIAAAVVVAVVVAVILLVSNPFVGDVTPQDPTPAPTASSSAVWAPEETPTPTPYAAPTFQALVNPDQSWMDYTPQNSEPPIATATFGPILTPTPRPGATLQPTSVPTPGPQATQYTQTVNRKSTAQEIRQLQQRLAQLGWLSASGVNGSYDSATKQAVKDFQNYINTAVRPTEKLKVDGIAGPKTLYWLYGIEAIRPTATPTAAVTPAPGVSGVIGPGSSKSDIRRVQQRLIVLGLLPSGSDDGVYGNSTTTAVKNFQSHVNQILGYTALSVTGTVDPDTLAYLDYYASEWERLRRATATPPGFITATPAPTATPTPAPDQPESDITVNRNSPKESIKYVQQMLIKVGLLSRGSDDGIYGANTQNAISRFQEWVNATYGPGTVAVTGEGDALTLQYLETASVDGAQITTTAVPTATQTAEPTPVPTDAPDRPEGDITVDEHSDPQSIRYVQQMLISVGALPAGSDDGMLGRTTLNSVRRFQQYVNSIYGAGTVNENGTLDALTLSYLEEAVARGVNLSGTSATAQPTAAPAQPPELSLNIDGATLSGDVFSSSGDRIDFDWQADGDVERYAVSILDDYGNVVWSTDSTTQTHGSFNRADLTSGEVYTIRITAIPAGGTEANASTIQARFSFTASPEPSDPPMTPITSLNVQLGGTTVSGVADVASDTARITWSATGGGNALYYLYLTDESDAVVLMDEATDRTEITLSRSELTPGQTYTLAIGALPENSTQAAEMYWSDVSFRFTVTQTAAPERTSADVNLRVNGSAATGVIDITGDRADITWGDGDESSLYDVTILDASGNVIWQETRTSHTSGHMSRDSQSLTIGEVYTLEVGLYPGGQGDGPAATARAQYRFVEVVGAAATEAPGAIESVSLTVNGGASGVVEVTGETAAIVWGATGNVSAYDVSITDSTGTRLMVLSGTQKTSGTLNASEMTPGEVYTVTVGAMPTGGGDTVWASVRFTRPAEEDDATQSPQTEQMAAVTAPDIAISGESQTIDGVQTLTGSTVYFSWRAEGDVAGYIVYLTGDGFSTEHTQTTETSRSLSLEGRPAGQYRIYVGAVPANAASEDDVVWSSRTFAIGQMDGEALFAED